MRKRCWSKGGLTDWSSVHEQARPLAQPKVVTACQLYKQIMRMLAVHNGQSVSGLSRLEKFRIPASGDGRRFQTQHGPERHCLTPKIARDHRHQPINLKQFVPTTGAALLRVG